MKPGQNLSSFMAEVKELSTEERAYFKAGLEKVGYIVTSV